MVAYRDYAMAYPHRYAAIPQHPVSDPELTAAGDRVLAAILAVLGGAGLTGADRIHSARCVRAAVHGFAVLQATGAFQLADNLDDSYNLLITLLTPLP
jgi:hypothetical protein